jgi:hypothetical protein
MITEPWEIPARSKRYGRKTRQSESESGCPTLMLCGKYVAKSVTVASSLYLLSSLYQKMRKKTSGYTAFVVFSHEKFLIDLFSKRSQGLGAAPQVASAEVKSFYAV